MDFGPLGPFWDPWTLFNRRILDPLGPFGTHGPDYERFYETLLFLKRQEAFWKDQNDSENPEWFWCITRPVMDPLGPLGPLDP